MSAVAEPRTAPTKELGVATIYTVPTWGKYAAAGLSQPLERVPELQWPISVRETYPRMRNDTQLSGLFRGTSLPIERYVWGIDPNGSDPDVAARTCAELGLETIEQAWTAFSTNISTPSKRSQNKFSFPEFMRTSLKAAYLGSYFWEQVYDAIQDGPPGLNGGWFNHIRKLAPRAPWTISQIYTDVSGDGGLAAIRQLGQKLTDPPIPVTQLVAFVFDQDPGDWYGNSLYRPCFREWFTKDLLYRIDTVNHEKAGGILLSEAPQGATATEIEALAQLSAQLKVGGGGALPYGTDPVFLRATGSDVIASINQRDEAMARAFLMNFMSLGTSSSGGNRALGQSFLDWFAIAQEAIAIWFADVVNEHVIKDFVDWNWPNQEYVPKLVFRRPEDANPLDDLAGVVTDGAGAGTPNAVAVTDADGKAVPVATGRLGGKRGAIVLDGESLALVLSSHAERARDIAPHKYRPVGELLGQAFEAAPAETRLPDRPLRRDPTAMEIQAAVDFRQIDDNWQTKVEALVSDWQTIRADQIAQLSTLIANAGGNLATLATMNALAAGGDLLATHLKEMASLGAGEAAGEATRQGVNAVTPELTALESELEMRATALSMLLASSISQAARTKAVQLSGGGLTPSEVATATTDYLNALTDTYLADQFGGALSAAQNGGRLAVMSANDPEALYSSELLDRNTCQPCSDIDGTEYATAEDAAMDYPAGGFARCDGGPRCRGSVVAVYAEAASA